MAESELALTTYSFDPVTRSLVATWQTGRGHLAATVLDFPAGADDLHARQLAYRLTKLSEQLWHTYTQPATAAESYEPGTEAWRRAEERIAFGRVVDTLRTPTPPDAHGTVVVPEDRVTEHAYRAGRALMRIGDAAVTDAVTEEIQLEVDAVDSAERGDLTGRAEQAVMLARVDPSPAQVAAADQLLAEDPLGAAELFTEVEPTAAAVAAAHWLNSAAIVTSKRTGLPVSSIVSEADNIAAVNHETPTLVLERLEENSTPRDVICRLVSEALVVRDGGIPDIDDVIAQVRDAEERSATYAAINGLPPERTEKFRYALLPRRLTTLDPQRPARDLLEDLLEGIYGCMLLFREHSDGASSGRPADWAERAEQTFLDQVRQLAISSREFALR